jgi:hypothetical protein
MFHRNWRFHRALRTWLAALMVWSGPGQLLAQIQRREPASVTRTPVARASSVHVGAQESRNQIARQNAKPPRSRAEALEEMWRFSGAADQEARAGEARREADAIFGREDAALQRALAKGSALELPETQLKAAAATASPSFAAALAAPRMRDALPAKEPFSPDNARQPLRPHLPKPRRSGDVPRGGLTPELRAIEKGPRCCLREWRSV